MHRRIALVVVAFALGVTLWSVLRAQNQQKSAAAGQPPNIEAVKKAWVALSAQGFVAAVPKALEEQATDAATRKAFEDAAHAEAARRLVSTDIAATGSYAVLNTLVAWGKDLLSEEQRTALRAAVAKRSEKPADLGYEEMTAKVALEQALGFDAGDIKKLIQEWLVGRDRAKEAESSLEWCCAMLAQSPAAANRSLSVHWSGSIRPPRDGQYTFSASLLRIDLDAQALSARAAMTVSIDGKVVLDTSSGNPIGQPVALSADKDSAIEVAFRHQHSEDAINYRQPAVAMLYWEGPDLTRQLVPTSALSPSPGGAPAPAHGLRGDYEYLKPDGQKIASTRVDPQIDFLWTYGDTFGHQDNDASDLWQLVVRELVARYQTDESRRAFAATLKKDPGSPLWAWQRTVELMNSQQRSEVLKAYQNDPQVMQALSLFTMSRLFLLFRAGAEPETIDLAGQWMQSHNPVEPVFTVEPFLDNRAQFYNFGDALAFVYPAGRKQFEDKYLALPDGRCCLGVAYCLAYAYAYVNDLDTWTGKLDARLADKQLAGDQRVDWLLARAQAEELRGDSGARWIYFPERYEAGWGWLDEASLAAASEPVALRVFREKLARTVNMNWRLRLPDLVQDAERRFTAAESKAALKEWKASADEVARAFDAMPAARAQEALAAHKSELTRRMQMAADRKDQSSVERYQKLINRLPAPAAPAGPAGPSP